MTEQEAENKIRYLYDTFKTNLQRNRPYTTIRFHDLKVRNCYKDQDILLVRTKDTVTFHFRYPIRPIQVILRLYKSPAEILMGFDVDCCCIGYDGNQLYTLPRGRRAINTRMNLVDVDRQSTTYEIRLAKYAKRGFSVGVPGLDFTRVTHHTRKKFWEMEQRQRDNKEPEPERQGLAKLIDFDKNARTKGMHRMFYKCKNFDISNAAEQEIYKQEVPTTELPDVPAPATGRGRFHYRRRVVATRQSDYEYFFVPFTPVITPKKIYSRIQFGINLIRTVRKVQDYIPSILATMDDIETILDNTNNTLSTITGRIQWLKINPGTQMVGSFNPVSKNFYEDAYVGGPKYQKKREKQKKALQEWQETRKFAKYTWYYKNKGDQEFTAFPKKKSNALERLYREKRLYKYKYNWRTVNWRLDLGQYAETKREKESIQKDAEMTD